MALNAGPASRSSFSGGITPDTPRNGSGAGGAATAYRRIPKG